MKIAVASKNDHKVKELSAMLATDGIEFVSLRTLGFEGEIEENGSTFEENALIKAEFVCKKYGLPALADDSGLCVDYLNGAPGIYSARYASTDTHNADDSENIQKLLKSLENVPQGERTAHFMCVIAVVLPDGTKKTFAGKSEGYITTALNGKGGFGYDPVFFSKDLNKTFGEATEEEKNAVSHRRKAVDELKDYLPTLLDAGNDK